MLPEIKAIEPQLKQILYGCVEHVQATKAALYLSASHDLNDKTYELVTSYQFNDTLRKVLRATDDLVERLHVKRNAFFVNGLGTDQRFSEMLFRQGTDRLLATPLFTRGRLVGFIDMRDKAGKRPFDAPDIEAARRISEELIALLGAKNLYGVAPIQLVDMPAPAAPELARPAPAPMPQLQPVKPPVADMKQGQLSPQAARAVEVAREILSKRQLTHGAAAGKRLVSESDVDVLRLMLPAALAMPGAVVVCVSAAGHMSNPQAMAAIAAMADDARDVIQEHVQGFLKRANQPHMVGRIQPLFPFGPQPLPITAAGITAVVSATVSLPSVDGLILTAAFERTPEANAQRVMQIFLKQIESLLDNAIIATSGRSDRYSIAERILEPDFQRFPELAEHCRAVASLSQRFAATRDLSSTQIETIRIAALVHDAGFRLLDYERLYLRPSLTAEELRGFHEHPVIGAALVEPVLGSEVAHAVLRHHERVDGKGYPSRLTGNQIPLASRVIQICDAWLAMTSNRGYKPALGRDVAAAQIRERLGTQFDEAIGQRFLKVLPEIG